MSVAIKGAPGLFCSPGSGAPRIRISKTHCVKGHLRDGNRTRTGKCRPCSNAFRIASRAKNGNWGRKGIRKESGEKWFDRNDYNRAFQIQGGMCRGCGRHQTELPKPLYVDHDHATMKARGLLCEQCNFSIGFSKDNPKTLRALADYLEAKR